MQRGNAFLPIRFISPSELYLADSQGLVISYRYHEASALAPAHLECSSGEQSLDYNESVQDPPGPNKPEWTKYTGTYRIHQWGQPADEATVQMKNGYLYLNQIRLITELEPGLFFTSDGEAVDFRGNEPTWRNIRLYRT
jgi:hypothetical protein